MHAHKITVAIRLLILTGFLTCVISPYLIMFGLPLFVVGGLLLLVWSPDVRRGVLWMGVLLLLYLPTTISWLAVYGYATRVPPTDFILPEGFLGVATVFYGEPCGEEHETIAGRRQFVMPDSGILVLRAGVKEGLMDERYYYRNDDGLFRPIPIGGNDDPTHLVSVGIYQRRMGSMYPGNGHASYQSFFVGSQHDLSVKGHFNDNEYGAFTDKQLQACRTGGDN